MQNNKENTNAFLIHISSFTGYLFPLGSVITPLIIWQTMKDKSPSLNEHGKEVLNFNISFSLYMLILGTSIFSFIIKNIWTTLKNISIGFNDFYFFNNFFNVLGIASLISIITFSKVALIILGAIKANNGEFYKYPLTIKFIK